MFGEDEQDEDKIFEPEDEYFGGLPPGVVLESPVKKIDGRSKAARLARANNNHVKASTNGHASPGMVILNQEQLSKLWGIVTGGSIVIDEIEGRAVARVSLDSFTKALPILLERL